MSHFQMTQYLQTAMLTHVFVTPTLSPPTVYLGLFTAFDPTQDGNSFTEVSTSATAYARQAITFSAPSGGVVSNPTLFDFPAATANWGNITYWGLFDAPSAGNMLYWGQVGTPQVINTGSQFEVAAHGASVAITGNVTEYLADAWLNHTLRSTYFTPPASIWTAIFTAYTSDLAYSELVDANYARQQATFTTPTDTVTDCANNADVNFGAMVNAYNANYVALWDLSSGGNMLLRGPLTPPKAIAAGKVFKFPVGSLILVAD